MVPFIMTPGMSLFGRGGTPRAQTRVVLLLKKATILSCPRDSTHRLARVSEDPEKLDDKIVNGGLLTR